MSSRLTAGAYRDSLPKYMTRCGIRDQRDAGRATNMSTDLFYFFFYEHIQHRFRADNQEVENVPAKVLVF